MKILKIIPGMMMLEQYGNKYIRYDGGQIVEETIQGKITDEDCDRILKDEITMEDVVNHYSHLGLWWDYDELRESLMKDYLRTQGKYSEQRLNEIIEKLRTNRLVFHGFYDYDLFEDYPERPLRVEGFTAKYLAENYSLTPLGAYNYLIYLSNDPKKALADLEAGLPKK